MTLRSLILMRGSTLGDAGRACGVSPTLFDRIDADRQPLPVRAARDLAAFLGLSLGDVLAEAPSHVDANHPMFFRPLPGIPGIDFENSPPYREPVEIPRILPDYPQVYMFRSQFTAVVPTEFARIGRHDGARRARTETATVYRPRFAVLKDGLCWTTGTLGSYCLVAFSLDPVPALAFFTGVNLLDLRALVVEKTAGRLWAARYGGQLVSRLDETTGGADLDVDVSPASPEDVLAEGGKVYAALNSGEVVRIDPTTGAIEVTVSAVTDGAKALGSAGDGTIYVVGHTGDLRTIDVANFTLSSSLTLVGPDLNAPESLLVTADAIFVSDRTSPVSDARVVRIDRQTLVSKAKAYPVAALGFPAGRLVHDGLYLWMPDEGGPIRKLLPSTLDTLLEVPDSAGASAVVVLPSPT